eukprot:9473167-Pyramimonas_sp.AAC.1
MAQPVGGSFCILVSVAEGAAHGERTDAAPTGWTSTCGRGHARFMLDVWAVGGAQAASCLVILVGAA